MLTSWLQKVCPFPLAKLEEIPGDASFRRYFRLENEQSSYIVMDASLQLDCCESFVAIAAALAQLGIAVPHILAEDLQQGYLLITDLGNRVYLKELCPDNADALYKQALHTLALLQTCREVPHWTLPNFDGPFMQQELAEFNRWFLEGYLKKSLSQGEHSLLKQVFTQLIEKAVQQPQVFIHRDYHSANLMVLPHPTQGIETGVLDFQDACRGPITYDLVSLLRDCYIDWPDEQVYGWVAYYYQYLRARGQLATVTFESFKQWFDWMGIQRHLKASFIFARKFLRDHTHRYLQHLPRTLGYVLAVSQRYPELADFHAYISEIVTLLTPGSVTCVP